MIVRRTRNLKSSLAGIGARWMLILPFAYFCSATAISSQTLQEAFEAAYANSNLLKTSSIQSQLQEEVLFRTKANRSPTVNFRATTDLSNRLTLGNRSSTHTGSLQLSGQYKLFDFGSNRLGLEIEDLNLEISRIQMESAVQDVLLNAADAFYQILKQQNLLELEKNNLATLETQLVASRNKFELGSVSRTQLNSVEARVAAAKGSVRSREGQLDISREVYRLAVGEYPEKLTPPRQTAETPDDLETALLLASERNPAILKAKTAVLVAEKNRAKGGIDAFTPPINLQGSVSRNLDVRNRDLGHENIFSIGLQYTIPLYTGGKAHSTARTLDASVQNARIDLQQQARVVQNQVTNAWHQLEIAESLIGVLIEERDYSKLALEGTRIEESLGAKTTLDVIEAEKDLLTSNTNIVEARINRDLAAFKLLKAMGILTPGQLGLALNQ